MVKLSTGQDLEYLNYSLFCFENSKNMLILCIPIFVPVLITIGLYCYDFTYYAFHLFLYAIIDKCLLCKFPSLLRRFPHLR